MSTECYCGREIVKQELPVDMAERYLWAHVDDHSGCCYSDDPYCRAEPVHSAY